MTRDNGVTYQPSKLLFAAAMVVAVAWSRPSVGADVAEVWEGQPYRIEASLAIAAPGDLQQQLASELPGYLKQRASTSIGSVWQLHPEVATGELRQAMLLGLARMADEHLPKRTKTEDKRLLLVVRATPWGYELSAREFDRYVERWGPTLQRIVRQREAVPEQLFLLAEQAVAPLAHFAQEGSNPMKVAIELRGADLPPTGAGDFAWLRPGDVLQPVLVRTTRAGDVLPGSATTIPWAFIEVEEHAEGEHSLSGQIKSAAARPLGARRGRTEAVAIGMRHDRKPTRLALRARSDEHQPLAGYEVFVQDPGTNNLALLGKSGADGEIAIPPGDTGARTLFIKSDGVTLARIPVVPGAEETIVAPLPDDEMRLRAAARLVALREDIVDVVARRTILMARVRQHIKEKKFAEARELMGQLDELPGTTQFRLTVERDAQLIRANDPQVQRRIDKLFSDTRSALGKFLNPQPIAALHEELRQAELHGQDAAAESDAS